MKPLISIITVCRNSEEFLAETMRSVNTQTLIDVEHIVWIGKCTDRTEEVAAKAAGSLTKIIHGSDKSMYDAINKAINHSSGHYVLILNSDDFLISSTVLQKVSEKLKNKSYDFFYCGLKRFGRKEKYVVPRKYGFLELLASGHGTFVPHPSFFISRAFIEKFSLDYSSEYKYAADLDYILRCLATSKNYAFIDVITTAFREHAGSITGSGMIDNERKEIISKFKTGLKWYRKAAISILHPFLWSEYLMRTRLLAPSVGRTAKIENEGDRCV